MVTTGLSYNINSNSVTSDRQEIINNILKLAKEEQKRGNTSITQDKLDNLSNYVLNYSKQSADKLINKLHSRKDSQVGKYKELPKTPKPKYPPLFDKFNLSRARVEKRSKKDLIYKNLSFKKVERVLIEILETLANILDNLHLFSKFPMFPKNLVNLLRHTNRLWVLILVFLIRKTISQLLNVIRKEKKVKGELDILKQNKNLKLLDSQDDKNVFRRYEKFLKALQFDKSMLVLELIGNFLDLIFNLIELYGVAVPDWFMGALNFASMFMTIYRMNKDDEYIDDNISEDLI